MHNHLRWMGIGLEIKVGERVQKKKKNWTQKKLVLWTIFFVRDKILVFLIWVTQFDIVLTLTSIKNEKMSADVNNLDISVKCNSHCYPTEKWIYIHLWLFQTERKRDRDREEWLYIMLNIALQVMWNLNGTRNFSALPSELPGEFMVVQ